MEFRTLPEVMAALGHDRVTVVKLDVEGMEFGVLEQLASASTGIEQLVVEMHAMVPNDQVFKP